MARSSGRAAVAAALLAVGYFCLVQLAAFVTPSLPSSASNRSLRSHVSLAATKADVDAAQKVFKLQQWAANRLASEGSPLAAAAAVRAQEAEAAYMALKAEADGQAPPAVAAPAVSAPAVAAAAAAPVAAVPSAVSAAELAEAKKQASLLTWAAKKMASEGAPQAAAMQAKAEQAVAAFEAMRQGQDAGAAMAAAAPAEPAPVASAPVTAATMMSSSSAPNAEAIAKAKKSMDLLSWAAEQLASKGAPQAAAMRAKAEHSRQTYEALMQEKELVAR